MRDATKTKRNAQSAASVWRYFCTEPPTAPTPLDARLVFAVGQHRGAAGQVPEEHCAAVHALPRLHVPVLSWFENWRGKKQAGLGSPDASTQKGTYQSGGSLRAVALALRGGGRRRLADEETGAERWADGAAVGGVEHELVDLVPGAVACGATAQALASVLRRCAAQRVSSEQQQHASRQNIPCSCRRRRRRPRWRAG